MSWKVTEYDPQSAEGKQPFVGRFKTKKAGIASCLWGLSQGFSL
ncbi:hypothetical protein L579_1590 [Pantoea sp. AS-PWVM4]|nr:hypothetical protein L579_1590 [Pantoea sp. AS-PWVM4]